MLQCAEGRKLLHDNSYLTILMPALQVGSVYSWTGSQCMQAHGHVSAENQMLNTEYFRFPFYHVCLDAC